MCYGTISKQLRGSLKASSDPRAARTRHAIVAAVSTLIRNGDEISIAAIAKTAGIGKSSFYAHFASLDALAAHISRTAFQKIVHELQGAAPSAHSSAIRLGYVSLVEHWMTNRHLYAAVSALSTSRDSYQRGVTDMANVIEEILTICPDLPSKLDATLTARYLAEATYGLLDAWLRGDIEATAEQLTDHLVGLAPAWLDDDAADEASLPQHHSPSLSLAPSTTP